MSNFLESGAVLPFGLLGGNSEQNLAAFNKTYKNTALKAGIVLNSYLASDPKNVLGICTEYDVLVIEQTGDSGAVPTTYKNCISTQGMGSIADFFESALRPKTVQMTDGPLTFKGQDGAMVFLLCLDGFGEKGIVIGSFNHPDRPTNLTELGPKLVGEYNGVNITVLQDGSCSLTFKGPTDNQAQPVDEDLTPTEFKVEADGSFQFDHSAVSIRGDKNGALTITSTGDTTINCANANVNAQQAVKVNSGADTVVMAGGDCNVTATGKAVVQAAQINLNGSSGDILTTMTDKVVDTIFGTPTVGVPTVKSG